MELPQCPVEIVLLFFEDRAKIIIVGYLLQGPLRPVQLRKKIGDISRTSLSNKLKELELLGVVEKRVFPEIPPKVEYSLTDLGKSFDQVIFSMADWGKEYQQIF